MPEKFEDGNSMKLQSNILVIAATDHFPLFKRAPLEWVSLIEAMKIEIKKLIAKPATPDNQSSTDFSGKPSEGENLFEHLLLLLKHIPSKIHSTPLPSFKRLLLHFEDLNYLPLIATWLKQFGVHCWLGWKHMSLPTKADSSSGLKVQDNKESFTEPERFIHSEDKNDDIEMDADVLVPPDRPIQMQSPPPSPYLGWVEREEDPPDPVSVTNPRSLKAVLFDENGIPVFNDDDIMEEFSLGEGVDDIKSETITEDAIIDVFDKEYMDTMGSIKVPNIIVDMVEADSLRQIARELESENA